MQKKKIIYSLENVQVSSICIHMFHTFSLWVCTSNMEKTDVIDYGPTWKNLQCTVYTHISDIKSWYGINLGDYSKYQNFLYQR